MAHHPRARRAGGFFTILLLLLVVAVGVGFWQGWFSLSTTSDEAGNGRTDVTLTIDKEKIEHDTSTAIEATRREAREAGEKIKTATDLETVQGVVQSVDPAQNTITIRTDDDEVQTFRSGEATDISADGEETTLSGIAAGDRVVIVYREGDERTADSVTITSDDANGEK